MSCDFKKILIIKYGSTSEIIDSLAVIKSIKNSYPNMQIDYFTEEIPAKLLSFEKNIAEIFSAKNLSISEIFRCSKTLKERKYDAVIDLNGSLKSSILTLLIGAKQVITLETEQNNSPVKNFYKSVSEKIDGLNFVERVEITVPQHILDIVSAAIPTEKDFVVLSTQTAKSTEGKKYRLNKFKELAEKIVEKYDVEVFVIGTARERTALSIFENVNPKIHNFAGRFNILECAAFLKKAKCVIGIDSAPIYISKSLGISTIGLFGATSPKDKGFVGENVYSLTSKYLSCIPCGKSRCRLRNEEYSPCLDDVSTEDITNLIDELGLLPLIS